MDTSQLRTFASSASRLIATSAQLARKQAELATLNNVTLPKLHYSIGKRIARLPTLPPELVPFRDRITKLESEIAAAPASEHVALPVEQGLAERAKQLTQQVARKASKAASDASATVQIQAAYVALGKEAVSRYGEKAVPKELQADLVAAEQQGKVLAEEIAEKQAKNSVGWLTPRRVVLGFASIAVFFLGTYVLRSLGSFVFGTSSEVSSQLSSAKSGGEHLSRESLQASHPSVGSDPVQAGARVTAEATHQAWNTFFDTMLNAPPRRDGEPESMSMSRDLVRISQISLANVDPQLSRLISALIDLQKERIGVCRKHELEIMASDREWASRFAEMEKAGGMAAAQARSPQEAQQAMLATSLLGNGYLTQQRNEAVSAMNSRWAEIYSQYDKRSAEIFDQLEALGPRLETRYQRRFLFP